MIVIMVIIIRNNKYDYGNDDENNNNNNNNNSNNIINSLFQPGDFSAGSTTGLYNDTADYIQKCDRCQRQKVVCHLT